jgi:hypothetical protein
MALSGTISGSVTQKSNYFSFYLTWSATQSISGNYSDITVKTYWKTNNTYQGFDTVGSRNASITINGTTQSITKAFNVCASGSTSWATNPYLIQTATQRVYHNNDGTKSITISVRANGYADVYGPSSSTASSADCTASGTITLNTIPRASTITSVGNVTLGNTCSVQWTPASSGFKYKVKFSLGSWSYTTDYISPGVTSVYTYDDYTIPNTSALLDDIPNSTTGTMTATLYTYNSSNTQIGSASSKTFTVTVPSSVVPTVGTITITPQTYSYLIQNKNTVTVSVSGCTAGTGSNIKSYTFSGPGLSSTTTSTSAISSVISSSGTKTYTVTVTDNRGRTASKTASITCYAYSQPSISLNAYRVASSTSTTENDSGTYVRCTYSLAFSSVNNANDITVKILYKKSSASSWSSVTVLTDSKTTSGNYTLSGIDAASTYIVYATVTDNYGGSVSSTKDTVFGTSRILNITKDGTGIAVGKMAESTELFDCRWPIKTDNPERTMANLTYKGSNLLSTTDDTTENWANMGNLATVYYNQTGKLNGQPAQYGYLLNLTTGPGSTQVHQLWAQQANGSLFHRGGNTSGIPLGNWKTVLDSSNYTNYVITPADYIVDEGTSGNITYRKWNSGVSEAWYYEQLDSVPLTTLMTENVYSNTSYNGRGVALPSGLFATGTIPIATANAYSNGYTCCQVASATATQVVYRIWSPYSATITGCRISIQIVGRWK